MSPESLLEQPTLLEGIPCYAPELAFENKDYPRESYDRLVKVEQGSFWFRGRQRIIEFFVRKYVTEPSEMLEIGCGTGFVLKGLSKHSHLRLTGAELHVTGLKWAKERLPGIDLIQLDATRIPFQNRFNAIGAFDVIEHIDEDVRVLQQCHRALKARGYLFLTVPQHMCLWSQADDFGMHKRRYSRKELAEKLSQAGFDVKFIGSFVSLLFPALYVSRFFKSDKKTDNVLEVCELQLPPFLDAIGEILMRIEEKLIFAGLSLPFGGSLVAVARKRSS